MGAAIAGVGSTFAAYFLPVGAIIGGEELVGRRRVQVAFQGRAAALEFAMFAVPKS